MNSEVILDADQSIAEHGKVIRRAGVLQYAEIEGKRHLQAGIREQRT